VLIENPVSVGQRLSEDDISELLGKDEYFRARYYAYNLLSYRQRTVQEIRDRLSKKGIRQGTAEAVVTRLKELDMVDDAAFALEYAKARVRSKRFGPSRIRHELNRKGVGKELIDAALKDLYADISPEQLALEEARKITNRLARTSDPRKRRNQLTAYLARRGFSFDQMSDAVKEMEALFRKE
jgi:regulatory protein